MNVKRKRYSAEFKAKVTMEAIPGELTASQPASKHGLHQMMIEDRKRQAMESIYEEEFEKLHAKIGQLVVERDFFSEGLRSTNVEQRRALIEPEYAQLSIVRQCELVSISRSSCYNWPVGETAEILTLMRLIDVQFLETLWFGSR